MRIAILFLLFSLVSLSGLVAQSTSDSNQQGTLTNLLKLNETQYQNLKETFPEVVPQFLIYQNKLQTAKLTLQTVLSQINDCQKLITSLKSDLQIQKSSSDSLKTQLIASQANLENLRKQLESLQQDLTVSQNQLEQSRINLTQSEASLRKVSQSFDNAQKDIIELKKNLDDAKQQIVILNKEVDDLQKAGFGIFLQGVAWGAGGGLVVGIVVGYFVFHK